MRPLPFIRTVNVCIRPRGRSFFLLTLLLFLTSFHAAFGQNPTVPQGASASFPATGTEAPAGSVTWDIVTPPAPFNPPSQVIATSSAPNGWDVGYYSTFTITAPSGATVGPNYKVRYSQLPMPGSAFSSPASPRRQGAAPTATAAAASSIGSGHSALFDVVSGSAPANVTNLTATADDTRILLRWSAPAGADHYILKRSTTSGNNYVTVSSSIAATSYTDTGLTNGTPYYYIVVAVSSGGVQSANSNEAHATPLPLYVDSVPQWAAGAQATTGFASAPNLVDGSVGDTTTGYGGGATNYASITVLYDLGTSSTPAIQAIAYSGSYINDLQGETLEYSPDLTTWTQATYQTADGPTRTLTLNAATTARYWRLTVTARFIGGGYPQPPAVSLTDCRLFKPVVAALRIDSLSPSTAVVGGAAFTMTVSGTGFLSNATVKFGPTGSQATLTTTTLSATQITVIVPASSIASVGTYDVNVVNPAPSGGTSNTLLFVVVVSVSVADVPSPGWAINVVPSDRSDADGAGPSSSESVVLPSGVKENTPSPDLEVYNSIGPSVFYTRSYRSSRAAAGYGSRGLSPGWVDNYDLTVAPISGDPSSWLPLQLTYPNGAAERWTPVLSNGQPTGVLTPPPGTPYTVQGIPGSSPGSWQSLTMTMKDRAAYTFSLNPANPNSPNLYLLSQISNLAGHGVTVQRDSTNRLTVVSNDASQALLTFTYAGPALARITDAAGRQITYTFGAPGSAAGLWKVSEINAPSSPRWQYDYAETGGIPYLNTVQSANPAASGLSSAARTDYDANGRVSKLTDANGNQRVYVYGSSQTQVKVYAVGVDTNSPAAVPVQQWTQKFDPANRNVDTGVVDAANHATILVYGDANNPYKVTEERNKNNQAVTAVYDQYGNLTRITDRRAVATIYTYVYPADWPSGQLQSVQTGSKTLTSFTYYNGTEAVGGVVQPKGLVKTASAPKPGTSGTSEQVTTTYVYTALGSVAQVIAPSPNPALGATATTTYNYVSDPGDASIGVNPYSQPESLGQALTVTDPNGNVTRMRYNSRGQVTALIDALGYATTYDYNTIDDYQLNKITYPATGQTGSGQAYTIFFYFYPGGPLQAVNAYDESAQLARRVVLENNKEGEAKSDTGDLLSVFYAFDPRYRLTRLTDGNNNPAQQFAYDAVGNLTSLLHPQGDGATFPQYDNDNNLLQRRDGRTITTTYTRASDDSRVTGIGYSDGTPGVQFGVNGNGYDQYDRVTRMTDGAGTTTYTYDDGDRITSVTTTYTGLPAKTISYAYFPDGSRATMTTPAGLFSYTYDLGGRMTDVASPWVGGGSSYVYDRADRLTQKQFSKVQTTYGYNARDFLVSLNNVSTYPNYGILSYFYNIRHDALGNRTNVAANIPQITYIDGSNTVRAPDASRGSILGYDTKDQLISEVSGPTYNNAYNDSYNYTHGADGAGNLNMLRSLAYTYDSSNRVSGNSYDGNGNPYIYKGRGFTYDGEDRIVGINGILTAGYTGDGQRAWKGDASGANRTYFLYDGDTVVCELDSSGSLINTYSYGPAGLVQRYIHSIPAYIGYSFDPQGTLVQRHRQYDNFVVSADTSIYDGFGVLRADIDAQTGGTYASRDSVGYKGESGTYTDKETEAIAPGGLISVGGSFYDATLGRFVTRGSDLNGYATDNNPFSDVDWLGVTQQGVDAVGLYPVLNVPAAVISGGISLYQGDYSGALLSVGSLVPLAGDAATALKIARNAKRLSKAAQDGSDYIKVYRGTSIGIENQIFDQTGHLMSEAARSEYYGSNSVSRAYKHSARVHQDWVKEWGNEADFIEAHGAFGQELPRAFGRDRTLVSVTTDLQQAKIFAGKEGRVYSGLVHKSKLIPQNLKGAGESEFLVRHMIGGLK